MSIAVSLDALLDTLTRVRAPLPAWLAPGIERPQIDARLGGFPARLADEVYDYFGWRNGLSLSRDADYELFPGFTVLSLDEALADYRMQLDAANRIARQASIPASSLWNERWLPLFRDAGGDPHVTVAAVRPAPTAPIYMVTREEPERAYLAYDSLTSLIQTVGRCFDAGAYRAVGEMVEEDRPHAAEILRTRTTGFESCRRGSWASSVIPKPPMPSSRPWTTETARWSSRSWPRSARSKRRPPSTA